MSDELARETAADGLCVVGGADLVVVLLGGARTELFCELEVAIELEAEGAREDLGRGAGESSIEGGVAGAGDFFLSVSFFELENQESN